MTQAEVDALVSIARDRAVSAPVVEPRDFRAPKRLSVEQLSAMAQAVASLTAPCVKSVVLGTDNKSSFASFE